MSLFDRDQILFYDRLCLREPGLGFRLPFPESIHFFHRLKLFGFQLVDLFFVAGHLVAEGVVFVVFLGLELLRLKALDRRPARFRIHLDLFHFQLDGFEFVVGFLQSGGVAIEFRLRAGFLLREFRQFLFQR